MTVSCEHRTNIPRQALIADWLAALSHDSPFERGEDNSVWDQEAPRLALVPILISLLQDPDRDVRMRAIAALAKFGAQAQRTLPVLRAALKGAALGDDDETVRGHAVHAVLQIGPEAASGVAALIDSLHDELDVVRFHAAVALGDLGRDARPAAPALIHAARWDEDPAVRVGAALALRKIDGHGPLAIQTLIEALGNDNELVCWIAADELGQMGPEAREAVPALQQALRRRFKMGLVARGISLAIGRIDPRAVADLQPA
jgi:HEAT repeat protein